MPPFDDLASTLSALERRGLYRRRRVVDGPMGREIVVDGRRLVNFSGNDYLGLANDPRLREAFAEGVARWGVGAGASHMVCGHTRAHAELEEALAAWTCRPRALLFSSGYAANTGTLKALLGRRDVLFQDRLNHASLLDGGWLACGDFHWYGHADPVDLERGLAALADRPGRRLVATDGTFSMDGDQCPLDALVDIARRHDAWLMVDDAHGIGVCGDAGRGVVDPARHGTAEVPVLVGTLGKAFGTAGAFVAGSEALVETLVQRARTHIYTTAMPAAVAVATRASLDIVCSEPWRRTQLAALIARFRAGAAALGLRLMPSSTPIQPLIVGGAADTLALAQALASRGLFLAAIRPPTVPAGSARLRITLSAAHEPADIDRLLEALGALCRPATGEDIPA